MDRCARQGVRDWAAVSRQRSGACGADRRQRICRSPRRGECATRRIGNEEAPRRSRHGETRKNRKIVEGENHLTRIKNVFQDSGERAYNAAIPFRGSGKCTWLPIGRVLRTVRDFQSVAVALRAPSSRKAQYFPLPIRRYKQGDHYHVTPNITLALSGCCLVSLPPRPDYRSLLFSLSRRGCHCFVLHYFFPTVLPRHTFGSEMACTPL